MFTPQSLDCFFEQPVGGSRLPNPNNSPIGELVLGLQTICHIVGQHSPMIAQQLNGISSELAKRLFDYERIHDGRDAASLLSGKGPLGRRVFDFITFHEQLIAKPLEEGLTYGFKDWYQKTFVHEYSSGFDNPAATAYQKLHKQAYTLKAVLQLDDKYREYLKSTGSSWAQQTYLELESKSADDSFELGVRLVVGLDQSGLYYYHPAERMHVYSDGLIAKGSIERLQAEFDALVERTGLGLEYDGELYKSVANSCVEYDELLGDSKVESRLRLSESPAPDFRKAVFSIKNYELQVYPHNEHMSYRVFTKNGSWSNEERECGPQLTNYLFQQAQAQITKAIELLKTQPPAQAPETPVSET